MSKDNQRRNIMKNDYHIHALAHGEYSYTREWVQEFINCAIKRNIKEMGFSEHSEFIKDVDHNILEELKKNKQVSIKFGVEIDYQSEKEKKILGFINKNSFDYIIGSVHFIDGWGFDHPDNEVDFNKKDTDEVYKDYFDLLKKSVQSNYFDIVGHLDLIKIWGHQPEKKSVLSYVEPVLLEVQKRNMVIELNSAGLRKAVGEIYPSRDIVERMFEMNIPITFSSDAHYPEQVGEGLEKAYLMAQKIGYRKWAKFKNREKIYEAF